MRQAIVTDKAIFIVVPKVANTSIKVALAEWLGKAYETGPRGPLVHGQQLFQYEYVNQLGKYDQPVIGFVRDPWSRLVSCYRNKIEGDGNMQLAKWGMRKQMPFDQFVGAIEKHWGDFNSHWAPCCEWAAYADYVIPFERLTEEWERLEETLGVPPLPYQNITGATDVWKSYYTDELLAKVRDLYKEDVLRWYADWKYGK